MPTLTIRIRDEAGEVPREGRLAKFVIRAVSSKPIVSSNTGIIFPDTIERTTDGDGDASIELNASDTYTGSHYVFELGSKAAPFTMPNADANLAKLIADYTE